LIQFVAFCQNGNVQSLVPLRRCDEADPAMPVFESPCLIQVREAVLRPLRAVFQGPEQRLRERIIVADPRPAA